MFECIIYHTQHNVFLCCGQFLSLGLCMNMLISWELLKFSHILSGVISVTSICLPQPFICCFSDLINSSLGSDSPTSYTSHRASFLTISAVFYCQLTNFAHQSICLHLIGVELSWTPNACLPSLHTNSNLWMTKTVAAKEEKCLKESTKMNCWTHSYNRKNVYLVSPLFLYFCRWLNLVSLLQLY